MSVSCVAIFALVAVTAAYPAKDEDSFYYGRLHDLANFNKEGRNLDAIDGRSAATKGDQDLNTGKGSQSKYQFGALSGSHIDGIGGGHLVRDELEQGVENNLVESVETPGVYHRPLLFPPSGTVEDNYRYLVQALNKGLVYDVADGLRVHTNDVLSIGQNSQSNVDEIDMKVKRQMDSIGGGHLLGKKSAIPTKMTFPEENSISGSLNTNDIFKRLDSLGGGHLLASKRNSQDSESFASLQKRLDGLGGGHLLTSKRNMGPSIISKDLKRLDSLGGGHLLASKRYLEASDRDDVLKKLEILRGQSKASEINFDTTDEYHILKRLDALGGGHLLASKRDLDTKNGYYILKKLDALGGGHLLSSKRNINNLDRYNILKRLDALGGGHLLASKRNVDFLDGFPVLKRLDALGGGHLLASKRNINTLDRYDILKRLDALGGGHLLASKRNVDFLDGYPVLKRLDALGGGHLLASKRDTFNFERKIPSNGYGLERKLFSDKLYLSPVNENSRLGMHELSTVLDDMQSLQCKCLY